MNRSTWDIQLNVCPLSLQAHLTVDVLQLPEVDSVLAGAGEAGPVVAEVASLSKTTAGDKDVILPPKIVSHL